MVSFLDPTQMRAAIAAGFKGKLLSGVLTRQVSGGVDEYGDPVPGTPATFNVEGLVSEYSDYYKAQAGIPETDVQIILIAGNCETDPLKDDEIQFPNFGSYKVRKVMTDPAKAHYKCQSFKV